MLNAIEARHKDQNSPECKPNTAHSVHKCCNPQQLSRHPEGYPVSHAAIESLRTMTAFSVPPTPQFLQHCVQRMRLVVKAMHRRTIRRRLRDASPNQVVGTTHAHMDSESALPAHISISVHKPLLQGAPADVGKRAYNNRTSLMFG